MKTRDIIQRTDSNVVWIYSIENWDDSGIKFVLSRRYLNAFQDVYDEFRLRNVKVIDAYRKSRA